jgi:hypothetical protein
VLKLHLVFSRIESFGTMSLAISLEKKINGEDNIKNIDHFFKKNKVEKTKKLLSRFTTYVLEIKTLLLCY